ncbi:MAG: trypsin-like peptidase domain-containing protein [Cellulomonas sp.]|nr:trypsin-like peptidase domain-containing protein [Cellulomonas sp.]MCR6648391.1 trypsin-like peptidase domain-containing protein [Cellulomonas sp.]
MTTPTPENHPQAEPTQPLPPVPAPPTAPQNASQDEATPRTAALEHTAPERTAPVQAQPTQAYPTHAPVTPTAAIPAAPAPAPAVQPGYAPLYAGPQPVAPQPAAPQQPGPNPWAIGAQPTEPPAPGADPARAQRRGRVWIPVTAAAAAALVAAAATLGVTSALDRDAAATGTSNGSSSFAQLGQSANDAVPVSGSTDDSPDWQAVAAAVQASVVAIQTTSQSGTALGSGVVIDDAGHIVTNNHVVAGAQDDKVQVTLTDGRIFTADVVGTDPTTDLAVIKLVDPPKDLEAAALGTSEGVRVGQAVMAVGNPLGLQNTVTTGIVSAVDRPVSTQDESGSQTTVTNAIQVDASVNPGNSGGPLFDAQGRVIGINSSIATTSQQSGSIGLGFAIPVDLVKNVAGQLIENGTAQHAFLGVGLDDGTATADGVTRAGAVVKQVNEGSPAADAGLQVGDVVVGIDGDAVGGAESLTAFVRAHASGDKVTLTVVRDDKAIDVEVTLATKEDTTSSQPGQGQNGQGQDGQGQDGQGQDQQGQNGQGQDQQGDQGGPQRGGQVPDLQNMTPEELWEWLQQNQG